MVEKRILIADADPKACNDFRQSLGQSWLVVGAATGDAAVGEARKELFDVVVANFELPDLNRAELLNRLLVANPKTLRFVASAEALREKATCQVVGSHRFLPIPYEVATLKSTIERALADDYGMSQSMRELVGRIHTFPTIPSLYIEVVNVLKDPSATTKDVGLIISQDMAMTTKLVQVINSSYYGLPRTITDSTEAVGILGFETVKSLIMTVKLLSQYDKVKPVYFSIDTIWRHSTSVAHTAKAIARIESSDPQCSGHAYTAGLMHDLGKVILAANFDEKYHEAHVVARTEQRPLWEVEKEILGASHAEIGAYLLGLWGMSDEVVRVAAFHHHPLRAGDLAFTALTAVHVANALEYEGDSSADGPPIAVIDASYLQQLGLEAQVDSWRRARRNPDETHYENSTQRAKAAAKTVAAKAPTKTVSPAAPEPAPVSESAPASAPGITKLAPAAFARGSSMWRLLAKCVGLGLGISAILAFLARLEILRLEKLTEKPEFHQIVEQPHAVHPKIIAVAAPAKLVATPPPTPLPPTNTAPAMALQIAPPASPIALPAPVKTALDRLKLQMIFFSSQHPSALINGQLASVNDLVADCRVLEIGPSSVTLEYQHQRRTLTAIR